MDKLKMTAQIIAGIVAVLLVIAICAAAVGIWTSLIGVGFGRGFMFGASGTTIALVAGWRAVRREKRK
ncbi:hypothetical protein [Nonomuraea jiangxiensis]|uniref:Uncharacterized protein n=1 Tax=Nonomuraea jiangxiensis TaxID=633440 RepID=A0A1G9JJ67_9ACTN|nr:hypothetical protein [Nonomuraea jiangxiensis]SDL37579.1 hypothetical protein SAMN05421869_12561 [Nonomuraea jiangxiensis]